MNVIFNVNFSHWSAVTGFEKLDFKKIQSFTTPDSLVADGETLKITFENISGSITLDFSAETDGKIEIDNSYSTENNTIIGGSGNDSLKGVSGTIKGNAGDDIITGYTGDDTITGGAGNDTIDGGLGTDIAIFSGNKSDYTITETAYAKYQVVDNRGTEGTDTLDNIETLRFTDQNVDITPSGQNLNGTSNGDTLSGNSGADILNGLGGDDTLKGLSLIHI